jgi:hypothetical protein
MDLGGLAMGASGGINRALPREPLAPGVQPLHLLAPLIFFSLSET